MLSEVRTCHVAQMLCDQADQHLLCVRNGGGKGQRLQVLTKATAQPGLTLDAIVLVSEVVEGWVVLERVTTDTWLVPWASTLPTVRAACDIW